MTAGGDERGWAFFCVADGAAYLPKAITALRSFQRFHPAAAHYVVGRFDDDVESLELIERHGLQHQQLDLSDVFAPTTFSAEHPKVTWPSACFWWTACPALFAGTGFRSSCALDGDTLCVAPLALGELVDADHPVAGVAKRNGRVNSGVLFFDNANLTDLFERAVDVYATAKTCDHEGCTGFCRTRGDQGLLHEMEQRAGLAVRRIDNAYNHMLTWSDDDYLANNPAAPMTLDGSRVLHLLSKPWRRPPPFQRLNAVTCDGYRTWWQFAGRVWADPTERSAHFGKQRAVAPGRSVARALGLRQPASG